MQMRTACFISGFLLLIGFQNCGVPSSVSQATPFAQAQYINIPVNSQKVILEAETTVGFRALTDGDVVSSRTSLMDDGSILVVLSRYHSVGAATFDEPLKIATLEPQVISKIRKQVENYSLDDLQRIESQSVIADGPDSTYSVYVPGKSKFTFAGSGGLNFSYERPSQKPNVTSTYELKLVTDALQSWRIAAGL